VPKNRPVSPHTLRLNDRVYQKYNPWQTGTVTGLEPGARFTVTYDFHDRKKRQPRSRVTYGITCQELFLIGNPFPGDAATPEPVHIEALGK
jgi:hypothetical protein